MENAVRQFPLTMVTAAHGLALASCLGSSASSEGHMGWDRIEGHQLFIVLLNGFSPWTQNISGCQNVHGWKIASIYSRLRQGSPSFGQQVMPRVGAPLVLGKQQQLQCSTLLQSGPTSLSGADSCTYLWLPVQCIFSIRFQSTTPKWLLHIAIVMDLWKEV